MANGKRGRRRNEVPSVRVRLDKFVRMPILDPREQAAYDWYLKNKAERKAAPMAWELLVAALNGELGPGVKKAVEAGNTQEAVEALQDLMNVFVS